MPRTIEKACNPQDWVHRAAFSRGLTDAQFRFLVMASEYTHRDEDWCIPSTSFLISAFASKGSGVPVYAHFLRLVDAGWLKPDPTHRGIVLTFPVWTVD